MTVPADEQRLREEAYQWRLWATGERKKPPHNLLAFTTDVLAVLDLLRVREQELAEANARAARLERVLYPPGDSPQRDDVPHLGRACELLWQAGHPAIAEALQHEVAAAVREAAELRATLTMTEGYLSLARYRGDTSGWGKLGMPSVAEVDKVITRARAALEATDD